MKLKILILSLLVILAPQLSQAISMGSISDAISPPSSKTATTTTSQDEETVIYKEDNVKQKSHKTIKQTTNVTRNEKTLPNPALFIEDAAMTGYIHSQLLLKKNIPNVSVSTENAIVSLSGTVDTQEQADTLVKTAYGVKGVKFVNTDRLAIRKKL